MLTIKQTLCQLYSFV